MATLITVGGSSSTGNGTTFGGGGGGGAGANGGAGGAGGAGGSGFIILKVVG